MLRAQISAHLAGAPPELFLLTPRQPFLHFTITLMVNVWVYAGVAAVAAATFAAWSLRRRRNSRLEISHEPVSGQWLAEARARGEEHGW